jgi:hypothetical protein
MVHLSKIIKDNFMFYASVALVLGCDNPDESASFGEAFESDYHSSDDPGIHSLNISSYY